MFLSLLVFASFYDFDITRNYVEINDQKFHFVLCFLFVTRSAYSELSAKQLGIPMEIHL